ncbi:MAG TPA: response regulator transcription factor [Burkholderiaceae bacterium]|nr:response regulator transcription factor [Burkholderiaceae bacterium]
MNAPKPRVLLVENDFTVAQNLYGYLELKGFAPDAAYDGHGALGLLEAGEFDAVILDIGLPGLDGYGVLQAIRRGRHAGLPVLMLTARGQLEDKLAAFELGADDYLVKPFALAEVEARLRVMLRHASGAHREAVPAFAGIAYDADTQSLRVHGKAVRLTRKSLIILELLLRHAGALVPRRRLEQALWPDEPPSDEALRSQMHLLRKALQEAGYDGIETVHGQGWKLNDPGGAP